MYILYNNNNYHKKTTECYAKNCYSLGSSNFQHPSISLPFIWGSKDGAKSKSLPLLAPHGGAAASTLSPSQMTEFLNLSDKGKPAHRSAFTNRLTWTAAQRLTEVKDLSELKGKIQALKTTKKKKKASNEMELLQRYTHAVKVKRKASTHPLNSYPC